MEEKATFQMFAQYIRENKIKLAGEALAEIFQIEGELAFGAALFYSEKLKIDPQHEQKTQEIRVAIMDNDIINALYLLQKCFGLDGPNSTIVYQNLRILMNNLQ